MPCLATPQDAGTLEHKFPQADVSKEAWWEVVGKDEEPAAGGASSPEPLDKYGGSPSPHCCSDSDPPHAPLCPLPPRPSVLYPAPPSTPPDTSHRIPPCPGRTLTSARTHAVMVEREDVVDAIAYFIASYVAAQPQAAKMEPKQLQAALGLAFLELRKGQLRRLWDWGKSLYRCAAVGYGALSVYTNPWLVNAVLTSLFTGSRVVCGLLLP